MGSYKLSKEAESDLIRIHQYGVRHYGEPQADKYFYEFFKRFEEITENPYLYASVDETHADYRRCVCGKDSIYYRIMDDGVEIVAIIGAQDIRKYLSDG